MLGEADIARLAEVIVDLKSTLTDFKERRAGTQQVVQQYNAGGTAMWVVVVMAAIIFTMAITLGPRVSRAESRMDKLEIEQTRKLERMQDYLNNIYQQAPWLRPSESADVNSNNHNQSSEAPAKRS